MILNVASKSGSLIRITSSAFNNPTNNPQRIGTRSVTNSSCRYKTRQEAAAIVAKLAVEPTDKSNPSTINVKVTPIASNVTMEIERKISLILLYVKKESLTIEKKIVTPIIIAIVLN